MKRIIVGTAGHIDHGKTRLIEALTGIDCDRWEEEKRRGITIDLGFAHLQSDQLQIGFVDVPGHERFIDNALAGLGGIRIALLVVAADEGVMPQTREHLAICELLEIPTALVVISKSDLVDDDQLELARLEIRDLLSETLFAGSRILTASSVTGDGIRDVRRELVDLAERFALPLDPDRPTRLPIDRVFTLKGLGQIVTGTLIAGRVEPGDVLVALPGEFPARIRSIQVHGEDRKEAVQGERTALRLGGVESGLMGRGTQLVEGDAYRESRTVMARMTLLADAPTSIEKPTAVSLHLATSEVFGRLYPLGEQALRPGSRGLAEIRLQRPVTVTRGDRFVIRRPSPPATLGGGVVLDPFWRRTRGRRLESAIAALQLDDTEVLPVWIREAGAAGLSTSAAAQRLGSSRKRARILLENLADGGGAVAMRSGHEGEERWIAPEVLDRIERKASRTLEQHFGRDRLAETMSKAEVVERILPGKASALADAYLELLVAKGVLVVKEGRVTLPGRRAEMSSEESLLARTLTEIFDNAGLAPPTPAELQQASPAKPQIMAGVLEYLRRSGRLVQLPGGLLIAASAIERIRTELERSTEPEISVGDFKARFDLTRKWAIPLLEHLDSIGFTRRIGNKRQIVGNEKRDRGRSGE